ncbi:kinase [Marinobacter sp.]|uniref:kinase n=1 Tax=Marinobacter sp. TaxID=50741 RepID=UPI001B515C94|nr:kinase [Marinobacter sp.]MBQ0746948.1 kinase [Marinobacter sp.]MBQ0832863.1 kinase [Marinobacter sp.]|tara:strand:+ start:271 stop:675 length:405 start_codon:yes stop_codon:yes gene_type:complete
MSQNEARYTIRSLFVTALATIIGTVLVLEVSGRINHSDNKDHVPVGDFQAVHIKPGETFRMSPKASELHAVCENGYLAVAADVDPSFRGILVDYKNRGVRCYRPSPTAPAAMPQPDAPGQPDMPVQREEPASDE